MKKYLVIYHSPVEAVERVNNASKEERDKGMMEWFAWKERLGDKLIDFGAPLFNSVRINADGSEGPSTIEATGFSIIQAENLEAAKALVEKHPHFSYDAQMSIEVHEMMNMNM